MNGGLGLDVLGFSLISIMLHDSEVSSLQSWLASFSDNKVTSFVFISPVRELKSLLVAIFFPSNLKRFAENIFLLSVLDNSTFKSKNLVRKKLALKRALSTIIFTAADWTLPADRFVETNFILLCKVAHKTGETLYPTNLSITLLAVCADTRL